MGGGFEGQVGHDGLVSRHCAKRMRGEDCVKFWGVSWEKKNRSRKDGEPRSLSCTLTAWHRKTQEAHFVPLYFFFFSFFAKLPAGWPADQTAAGQNEVR